mmetsp:Transcript_27065/g.41120  ORF Transcript_27065/g.41120 Transcript_27065/m.41120 type:complete len:201 (-) Transcript_27065:3433-4035(-)
MTRVSKSFVHSESERAWHLGLRRDGFISSSFAVTTVASFVGSRGIKVSDKPVIFNAILIALDAPLPFEAPFVGSNISSSVNPDMNSALSAIVLTSFRKTPSLFLSCSPSHFEVSKPPTEILPRTFVVVNESLLGLTSASAIAVSNRDFPDPFSPKIATTSPLLHVKLTPLTAHAFRYVCDAHKSSTLIPSVGEMELPNFV